VNDSPDTLRSMVSTDNHLGYAKMLGVLTLLCSIRRASLPLQTHCDMVLVREANRRCCCFGLSSVGSWREICFTTSVPVDGRYTKQWKKITVGPAPVRVQVLSANCPINCHHPNYAVQMPIFSIHGNYDDPSRDPGSRDLLAVLGMCLRTC